MAGGGIDPEILGRLAAQLEESGSALKSLQAHVSVQGGQISQILAKQDSANARIKSLEHKIDGNGTEGLRTEVALIKQKIAIAQSDVDKIDKWKDIQNQKSLEKVEKQSLSDRSLRWTITLSLGSMGVAIASLLSKCGPL